MQLVAVAGDPGRDPRKHVVSIVYAVSVDPEAQVRAADDAASADWYDLQAIDRDDMAFDHGKILSSFLAKREKHRLGTRQ